MSEPDKGNMFLVASSGGGLVLLRPFGVRPISLEEAANLAAWLLVMSRTRRETFDALVEAIENS